MAILDTKGDAGGPDRHRNATYWFVFCDTDCVVQSRETHQTISIPNFPIYYRGAYMTIRYDTRTFSAIKYAVDRLFWCSGFGEQVEQPIEKGRADVALGVSCASFSQPTATSVSADSEPK
jgi:hypothetical protein